MNKPTKNSQSEDKPLTSSEKSGIIKEDSSNKTPSVARPSNKKSSYKFKRKRDGRVPFDKRRKLSFSDKKEDLMYYWYNESTNDFKQLQEDGYAFVNKSDNEPRDSAMPSQDGSIVRRPVGNGEYAYLMCTPQKWWDEHQAEKQKRNDEIMKQIGKEGLDCIPVAQRVGGVEITVTSKEEKSE